MVLPDSFQVTGGFILLSESSLLVTDLACYFEKGSFEDDDFEIASHLGIGLIRIDSKLRCHRESRAPAAAPIPRKRQELLEHLGFVVCQLCEVAFPLTAIWKI